MLSRSVKPEDIRRLAISSRLTILAIQILALELLPVHENDGFKFRKDEGDDGLLDPVVDFFLKGFTSWDGQYFLHISTKGYTEENTMAFFPLFPSLVWVVARVLFVILYPLFSLTSLAILVGFILNTYFLIKSAQAVSQLVPYFDRGMENLMFLTVILYCFNPASIFFTAFYSESLFAYLTTSCLLSLYRGKYGTSFAYAVASSLCRSNGILNFGFYLAFALRDACQGWHKSKSSYDGVKFATDVFLRLSMCAVGFIPFLGFQMFCYQRFCSEEYVYPAKVPDFCIGSSTQLPYQYIQAHNWNVGFLKYFELKQLPNFVLALPVLAALAHQCFPRFIKCATVIVKEQNFSCIPSAAITAHGAFLTVFCLTCMHVQVSTRLIFSSCPYLVIFIAKSLRTEVFQFRTGSREVLPYSFFIYGWFLVYFIIGTLAFSAGYPWT